MDGLRRYASTDWFGPLAVTLLAAAIIATLNPSFLSPLNVQVLLSAIAINTLITFSQMIIIAIGQMNLSVGAIGGLAAISFAGLMQVTGLPAPLAAVAALAIGLCAGVINGMFIVFTGISAFVITLATLSVYKGVNLAITRAQPFYEIPDSVKAFGNTTLLGPLPWLIVLVLICINEAIDLQYPQWKVPAMDLGESAKDLILTIALPTMMLVFARLFPRLWSDS